MVGTIWRRLAAIAMATVLVGACGSDGPPGSMPAGTTSDTAPTSAATLSVLCTVDEGWCAAQTTAFEAATAIPTTYVRRSAGDALALLRAAAGKAEFSVWWGGSSDGYEAAKTEGLLEAYRSPNAATVPTAYKDASGLWTGVYAGVLAFCSNSHSLAMAAVPEPTSWNALLAQPLAGKVSMAHPTTSGTAYTALWTIRTLNGNSDDTTFAYLAKLKNNVAAFTKGGTDPVVLVAKGTASVGVVFAHDCLSAINKGEKQLTVSVPKEGTGYEIGATALLHGAPNPGAARKWIDWVLTAKAQEIGATANAFQLPLNPDATVPSLSVKLNDVTRIDYDANAAGARRKALTDRFEKDIAPAPTQ